MCITIFSLGHGFCPMASATGRVGYTTRVQDWTRVTYPTCPMALATGCKPNPFHYNHVFRLTLIRVYYNPDLI